MNGTVKSYVGIIHFHEEILSRSLNSIHFTFDEERIQSFSFQFQTCELNQYFLWFTMRTDQSEIPIQLQEIP